MNIHEYQAKQLFAEAGVAVPNGTVAQSADNFDHTLSTLPEGKPIVVKLRYTLVGGEKELSRMDFKVEFMLFPMPMWPRKKRGHAW